MPDNQHDVETLNRLLATVVDSIDGFAEADGLADGSRARAVFDEVIAERRALARDIEAHIAGLGGTAAEKGTVLASAHRVLMRLRDALSSGDAALVAEAERGEDYIVARFDEAAGDDALSVATRAFVAASAVRVRQGHQRITALRHDLASA